MLALSHTYVSTKVTGRKSPLLVFGSVLPDIATTSRDEIGRDEIHHSPREFYNFIKERFGNLIDLAAGVRLHSNIDKGADYYSDDSVIGFAKIEGRKLAEDVKKLMGIDDERIGLELAHNFIEAGIDLNLKDFYPEIFSIYSESMSKIDLQTITNCLFKYLDLEKAKVLRELKLFTNFLSPRHFSSVEQIADGVAIPLIEIRFRRTVDSTYVQQILLSAKEITKGKFVKFLDETVEKMRIDFPDLAQI